MHIYYPFEHRGRYTSKVLGLYDFHSEMNKIPFFFALSFLVSKLIIQHFSDQQFLHLIISCFFSSVRSTFLFL